MLKKKEDIPFLLEPCLESILFFHSFREYGGL